MSPTPTTSSCAYCRCRFPTSDITKWVDAGRTPLCPRCGVDAVMAAAQTDADLERLHVRGFGGTSVLLDALRSAGIAVHGLGFGVATEKTGLVNNLSTIVVRVGTHQIEVVVDPPGRDAKEWCIRVPTKVVVRVGEADPGRATRVHDAGIAPALRAAGFTLAQAEVEVLATEGSERHRAVWERTSVDAADTASVIKAINDLETTMAPDPDDGFWSAFGDIGSMQALASTLSGIGTATVTPWGLTLRALDGRDLAVIDVGGKGTFTVAVVLTEGHGARAAKKRSESVRVWFEREVAPEWRAQGFTKPRRGPVIELSVDGVTHCAVALHLSFEVQADVAAKLRWAGARNLLAFPESEYVPTRRPKPVEVDRSMPAATEFFMALTHEGPEARAGLREWFVNNTDDFVSVRSRVSAWIDSQEPFSVDGDGRPEWAALGDVPPRSAIIVMDGLLAARDLVRDYRLEITRPSGVTACDISVFADAQDYQTPEQLPILYRAGYAFPPSRTAVP